MTAQEGHGIRVERVASELARCGTWVTAKVLALRLDIGEQRAREALADLIVAGRAVRRESRPKAFSRSVVYASAHVAAETPDPGAMREDRSGPGARLA